MPKYTAHVLGIDNFNNPRTVTDNNYIYLMLARLILLEPNTIQSHPHMGVGIVSKYRYSDTENVARDLQKDITDQVAMYLPNLQGVDVSVTTNPPFKFINIVIGIDQILYDFNFNVESGMIDQLLTV